MDFQEILLGLTSIQGGALDEELQHVEFRGPYIDLPTEGLARVTLFERVAGESVWRMVVTEIDRPTALMLLEMQDFSLADDE
jgi:hypothetical protein